MGAKTAEELLTEIKQHLQDTEEGSAAAELDEAINDVLDMITEFEKLQTYKYTLIMDDIVLGIGTVKAKTEAEAEAIIENEIMPKHKTASTYFMELAR